MKTILVIPCYNEAARLKKELFRECVGDGVADLLLVNDGSTDATAEIVADLVQSEAGITSLNLPVNSGKAEAVRQGVLKALESGYEAVGFWDADLAAPLAAVRRFQLFLKAEGRQMVSGIRVQRLGADIDRRWYRHSAGRLIAAFVSVLLGLPTYDTQCGAKLLRRDFAEKLFAEPFVSTWLFDVELLARAIHFYGRKAVGEMVYELPLEQWHDVGVSKVKLSYMFKIPGELRAIHRRWLR